MKFKKSSFLNRQKFKMFVVVNTAALKYAKGKNHKFDLKVAGWENKVSLSFKTQQKEQISLKLKISWII